MVETRACQSCKKDFTIDEADFDFYKKVGVPPPTFCPQCRMIRRFAWRNERFLYRKPDSTTGKMLFSSFPAESPVKVISQEEWSSDSWDAMQYGREYDFSKSFFTQFRELMLQVPWAARWVVNIINSDYNINTNDAKDCYLVMSSSYVQNSAYSVWLSTTEDSMDLYNAEKCSFCYESTFLKNCSRIFFSTRCDSSQNLLFCRDCVGCSDCFGSVNLRNKSYCFFNEQLTKEEYEKRIAALGLGSHARREELEKQVGDFWLKFPVRYVFGRQNQDTTGEYIFNSKNVHDSYNIAPGEDLKYCQNILKGPAKDSYDYSNWGENAELMYEALLSGLNISNCRFTVWCWTNDVDLQYSMNCRNSSHLFGCIGLNNKQYCILNKQYSKEEYEALVPRIIKQMSEVPYTDKQGLVYRYGEFFPIEFSPSPYNETIAQEFMPITKEEAVKKGFFWREEAERDYAITKPTDSLSDRIQDVTDSILDDVVGCAHGGRCADGCSKGFKLTKQELEFYRRFSLPLPRLCFSCRHIQRLTQRNLAKLFKRSCQCVEAIHAHHKGKICSNEFMTAYTPDRPEIVYCEQCYQAEVA